MELRKGEIYLANLEPSFGKEQGRIRPVLIIQNDTMNSSSPITIVAPITSRIFSKHYPTNVEITPKDSGLKIKSTILFNQIKAIDKRRIIKKLGEVSFNLMKKVDSAIKVSLDLS